MSILILGLIGFLIGLWVNNSNNITFFDSFRVEHIPKEIKNLSENKNIKTNIFRIQAYDSIMWDILVLDLLIICLKEKL